MKKLVVLLLVVSLVCVANAADIRYQGSGVWEDIDPSDGAGWIGGVMPGSADTARASWADNTITLDYAAPTILKFQAGVNEKGTFHILSGGVLTATSTSSLGQTATTGTMIIDNGGTVNNTGWVKVGSAASSTGILTVDGTMTVGSHLWVGAANLSTGTININSGGIINVNGMLGLGTGNTTAASGGTGTLNVNDGGTLNLSQIYSSNIIDGVFTTGCSIMGSSMLNINGSGVVTKTSNFEAVINAYIAAGLISGNGIVGNVQAVWNEADNKTYVTAIPEPATMALLGLGALALLRKKR